MRSISDNTLGPLIAYLVPGVTALVGLSPFIPVVQSWLAGTVVNAPTIGGFLYLTVASLAAGMILNAVRWAVVDQFHARTGLRPPSLDFSRLGPNVEAMRLLIAIHYQHYQFYSNMLVATAIAWASHRTAIGWTQPPAVIDLVTAILEIVFFATSRDTLRRYYIRTSQLLSPSVIKPVSKTRGQQ